MANSLQINANNSVAGLGTFSYTIPGSAGVAEVTDITAVADVSTSLNDTYFNLFSAHDAIGYYVWYNVDGGGTDPAIVGKTGIEVAIVEDDTADAVALATRTAIALISDFVVTGATDHIIVTNAATGITTDASDGAAPTGFAISVTIQGVNADNFLNVNVGVNVKSTIPHAATLSSNEDSDLTIAIKQNSSTVVSVGGSVSNPTPTQPSMGANASIVCSSGDTVSVVLSSSAIADNKPNSIKSEINLFLGV